MATARAPDFSAIVREAFAFLTEDLRYSLAEDDWDPSSASWTVHYASPRRAVELVWGLKDQQFYFRVLRDASEGDGQDWFYVFELMHHLEPGRAWDQELDVGPATPLRAALAEKVEANALALREYGWSILAGDAWFAADGDVS